MPFFPEYTIFSSCMLFMLYLINRWFLILQFSNIAWLIIYARFYKYFPLSFKILCTKPFFLMNWMQIPINLECWYYFKLIKPITRERHVQSKLLYINIYIYMYIYIYVYIYIYIYIYTYVWSRINAGYSSPTANWANRNRIFLLKVTTEDWNV